MQQLVVRLAVLATLLATGYGLAAAGPIGALTGFVSGAGAGSGLAVVFAKGAPDPALPVFARASRKVGGALAAIACLVATYHGGWHMGWAWGLGGYLFGTVAFLAFAAIIWVTTGFLRHAGSNRPLVALPATFDLDNPAHVAIIDDIRMKYATLLADQTHPYARCMYRPAAMLPFPKVAIKTALVSLLDFSEGRRPSRLLDQSLRTPDFARTLNSVLLRLDDFLEVPANSLPTEPTDNSVVGTRFR